MTLDKIKHYMDRDLFEFWSTCKDVSAVRGAAEKLQQELDRGLLSGIKYQAELQLLRHLGQ